VSLMSYLQSREISGMRDWDFSALVMAAMRKADTHNFALLADAFPEIAAELQARYDAPGGALNEGELAWVQQLFAGDARKAAGR
jgi:hypothetical protein